MTNKIKFQVVNKFCTALRGSGEYMRQIDVEQFCKDNPNFASAVYVALSKAPTIDAVPVVRCKDCKHRGMEGACPMCHDEYDVDEGWYTIDNTKDDGFCDRGERWDENAAD